MGNKLYDEYVTVEGDLHGHLRTVMRNHLRLHNLAFDFLKKKPSTSFTQLKREIRDLIESNKITIYIEAVLFTEIHYLYKRFCSKLAFSKPINGVGYLSLRVSNYNNNILTHSYKEKTLQMKSVNGHIALPSSLPILKGETVYLNISYSPDSGKFKITLFE